MYRRIQKQFHDSGPDKNLLDMKSTKAKATQAKINERDYAKLKNFCIAKKIINRVKKTMEWEKIVGNHISYNELVSKIYKELIQLRGKMMATTTTGIITNNNPIKNGLKT